MVQKIYNSKHFVLYCFIASIIVLLMSSYMAIGPDSYFYINAYDHFLKYPGSNMYQIQYFLTFALGDLMGISTIWQARLWGFAFIMLIWIVVYIGLKHDLDKKLLAIGLLLSTMGLYGAPMELGYNHFTVLFITIGFLLLYKSLSKSWLVVISGIFFGVAVYFRFPNIVFLVLCLVPIAYHFINKEYPILKTISSGLQYLLGFTIGLVLMYLIMNRYGYWDIFIAEIKNALLNAGNNSDTNHGSANLIKQLLKTYLVPLGISAIYYGAFYLLKKKRIKFCNVAKKAAMVVTILIFFAISRSAAMLYWMIGTPVLLYILFNSKYDHHLRYLALLAGIMMYLSPLGTQSIMSFYAPFLFWIALPVALETSSAIIRDHKDWHAFFRYSYIAIFLAVLLKNITFVTFSLYKGDYRWNSKFTVKDKKMEGIYVSKEKADAANTLKQKFGECIPNNIPLICRDCNSPFYLNTLPYGVSTGWIPLTQEDFMLDWAYKEQNQLPWILGDKDLAEKVKKHFKGITDFKLVKRYKSTLLYRPVTVYKNE